MRIVKKLLSRDLEELMSLSKQELRSVLAELSLPFGTETPKDDSIKNVSDSLIHEHVETSRQMISQIENEEIADV